MNKWRIAVLAAHLLLFCDRIWSKRLPSMKPVKGSWRKTPKKISTKDTNEDNAAYEELARYLKRFSSRKNGFEKYNFEEIANGIESLASSQSAWKSIDGLTHQFKNTFKTRYFAVFTLKFLSSFNKHVFSEMNSDSLQSRFDSFLLKKRRSTKEAAKIREYITTVERGLQAAEILQSIHEKDETKRLNYLQSISLKEIDRFKIHFNKVHCTVSVSVPLEYDDEDENQKTPVELRSYYPNELIVSIVDDVKSESISIAQLLRLMTFEEPMEISLAASPSSSSTADDATAASLYIQPTFLELSLQICERLMKLEVLFPISNNSLTNISRNVSSSNQTVGNYPSSSSPNATGSERIMNKSMTSIHRIRVLGHSSGGGVGAYLSMVLDGSLNVHNYLQQRNPTDQIEEMVRNGSALNGTQHNSSVPCSSLFGRFPNRIRAFLLGCPPCINRRIVPKYITCIINGDDLIPRAQSSSLKLFQNRILEGLKAGMGKKTKILPSWMLNSKGMLKDIKSVAGTVILFIFFFLSHSQFNFTFSVLRGALL
jgi:hypothetical protein